MLTVSANRSSSRQLLTQLSKRMSSLAFINHKQGIGFAEINLKSEPLNLYGKSPALSRPFFTIQTGSAMVNLAHGWGNSPGLFSGKYLTPFLRGSVHREVSAFFPFLLRKDSNPFFEVERINKILTHPLQVTEYYSREGIR